MNIRVYCFSVLLLLLGCLLTDGQAIAQEQPAPTESIQTDIESLHAPSSPAFGILDLNPSSIARPTSPKEFRASILNSIAESETTVPGNIALEISPYWWSSRPNVSFENLFVKPKTLLTIKQSASYSLATVTRAASTETESTDVALGVRFSLVPGKLSSNSKELSEKVVKPTTALLNAWRTTECKEGIRNRTNSGCPDSTSAVSVAASKSVDDFKASLNRRVGFQVDIASAVAYNFESNDTSNKDFQKGGLWVTGAYTPESNVTGGFQFLSIVRYLQEKNSENDSTDTAFDTGLRLIWRHTEEPLALSLEYINRARDEGSDAERYAGVFEYRINDTLSFTASFGKNFKEEGSKEDLFILSGVAFNFGKGPQVMFDKTKTRQ